jgi:hypothetical protein
VISIYRDGVLTLICHASDWGRFLPDVPEIWWVGGARARARWTWDWVR